MEALAGGRAVCEIDFDVIFTSRLVRAKQTALIAMTQVWIHNLLYMLKAYIIVCDAFVGYDQCCLVYRWTHGIKEPTYGYQNCNTSQILIFGGYVKVRKFYTQVFSWVDTILNVLILR